MQFHFTNDDERRHEMEWREEPGKSCALARRVDRRTFGQEVATLDVTSRERAHGLQKRGPAHRFHVPVEDGLQPRLDAGAHEADGRPVAEAVASVAWNTRDGSR